jgi:hypothetical protein
LVKNAYLTKSRTNTTTTLYAGRSKDSSWEDDEIDNIVKMEKALDVKWTRESVRAMRCMKVLEMQERGLCKLMTSKPI